MKSPLQQLIEKCRREQNEWKRIHGFIEWATEDEALEQWRNETFVKPA